jgi:hypothetical protein
MVRKTPHTWFAKTHPHLLNQKPKKTSKPKQTNKHTAPNYHPMKVADFEECSPGAFTFGPMF